MARPSARNTKLLPWFIGVDCRKIKIKLDSIFVFDSSMKTTDVTVTISGSRSRDKTLTPLESFVSMIGVWLLNFLPVWSGIQNMPADHCVVLLA